MRYSPLFFFIFSFVIGFAQSPVPGNITGYTSGSFNVTDGGAATYGIPFSLTPGSAGFQPSVSIAYSSQGGNGLLGLGWSIQGLSVISRAAQTIAQDNKIKGINFTPTDRFALDGERLVLLDTTHTYGGNNIEYRTEQNAFYKIISYSTGNVPTSFKVLTNSGLIMEYGLTANSRVEISGTTVFWLISKISDTKGNYYTFSYYTNNATGDYYPLEIKYTGNAAANILPYASVKFEYENRLDTTIQYNRGNRIVGNSKRLKSITNYFKDTAVRSYTFTYQYTSANLSQLISVKECGRNGECHDPSTFSYTNVDSQSFSTSDITNIQQSSTQEKIFNTDINADGVQDIIKVNTGANIAAFKSNKNTSALSFSPLQFSPAIYVADKLTLADFNGDGKQDFLTYSSSGGGNSLFLNKTSPSDTQVRTNTVGSVFPSTLFTSLKKVVTQDFNGDGRSDILTYDTVSGASYWMFSTATSNSSISFLKVAGDSVFTNIIPVQVFQANKQTNFADFNGDGLTDLLVINTATGDNIIYYNEGGAVSNFSTNSQNIIPAVDMTMSGGNLFIQDMNGDGLPDFLMYKNSTGDNYWWLNSGNTIFNKVTAQPANLNTLMTGGDNLLQTDFNSDGFCDIILIRKATGNNKWFVNDGKLNFTQLSGNFIDNNDLKNYDFYGAGNFTSKSNLDLFLFNNNATVKAKVAKCSQKYNNLLSKISVGNGQNIDIEYDFLTSDSIYTKTDNSVYPLMDYKATQFVVKAYQVDNGIGGKSKVSYHYKGAKLHLEGRGFRGFTQVDITDVNTGIVQSKYYMDDQNSWKYISSPLVKSITRLPNNVVISETNIENGLKVFYNGKCHYSFVKKNVSKTYELNGNFVDSTVTTQDYDDYGNVISSVTQYGNGLKDSLINVFQNNSATWILGRLRYSRLYRFAPGKPVIVKSSSFDYDSTSGTGLLIAETIEPDSGNTIKVRKTYLHDAFGNIIKSMVSAWNGSVVETRTTNSVMDSLGRFTVSFTNAIGQVSQSTYDPYLGHVLTEKNINNKTTQYQYDGMGRLVKTIAPDGNWVAVAYRKCSSSFSCPSLATHLIYTQSSTGPPVIKYMDLLDRELRTERKGFNGSAIYIDVVYDNKGLVIKRSDPYYASDTAVFTYLQYDVIGRNTIVVSPGSRIDSIKYEGRTTTSINALGQKKTIIKDAKEQLIISRDNQGADVSYEYDAAGRLLKITDPKGNTIIKKYDVHGNTTEQQDPDMGTFKYSTNGFRELTSQTDAKSASITLEYDSLGRLTKRTEPEGVTRWVYDTAPNGKGLLDSVVSYNYYMAKYTYDTLSRISTYTQRIDSQLYTESYTYDSAGRLSQINYPSGFSVKNIYNSNGYLYQVKNSSNNTIYWTANKLNAKDEVELQTLGNGTEINKVYDRQTDFLKQITTKKGTALLQNNTYEYNALGTLLQRKDVLQSKQEDFWYDNINRLIKSKVAGLDSVIINYDTLGNITFKSDVGTYTYGGVNAGPHQVKSIDVITKQCVPTLLTTHQFNSFNKVKELVKDSFQVAISYNPDRLRNLQKMYVHGNLVRKKVYVTGMFEKEIKKGDTIMTHYIRAGGAVIATYTTHSVGTKKSLQYLHRDHLGSTVMVTNDTGGVIAKYSFDAWGKRRNADWSSILTDTTGLNADRGFTGHEHYDLFDLVDMNGRIYDPVIGRFISPDPYVQDITNLQSLNRYSYVLNNPMSYTDPSGYFLKGLFKGVGNIFKGIGNAVSKAVEWVGDNWRQIATVAVAVVVGSMTAGWGVALSGAASGFSSTVTGTLLSGGSIGDALKAGIKSAVIASYVADYTNLAGDIANPVRRALTHGVIQGTSNVAEGGKFVHGFYSGVLVAGTSDWRQNTFKIKYERVVAASIIGGTAAEISGGKFANGAITGAFIQMYNEEMHAGLNDMSDKFDKQISETQSYWSRAGSWAELLSPFPIQKNITKLFFFGVNVRSGSAYDLKNHGYSAKEIGSYSYYHGTLFAHDDYGNYNYGVAAKSFGLSLTMAKFGAGSYQIWQGKGDFSNYFETYGDDPRDTKRIVEGYNR